MTEVFSKYMTTPHSHTLECFLIVKFTWGFWETGNFACKRCHKFISNKYNRYDFGKNDIFAQNGHWLCSGCLPTPLGALWTSVYQDVEEAFEKGREVTKEAQVGGAERKGRCPGGGIKLVVQYRDKVTLHTWGEATWTQLQNPLQALKNQELALVN